MHLRLPMLCFGSTANAVSNQCEGTPSSVKICTTSEIIWDCNFILPFSKLFGIFCFYFCFLQFWNNGWSRAVFPYCWFLGGLIDGAHFSSHSLARDQKLKHPVWYISAAGVLSAFEAIGKKYFETIFCAPPVHRSVYWSLWTLVIFSHPSWRIKISG